MMTVWWWPYAYDRRDNGIDGVWAVLILLLMWWLLMNIDGIVIVIVLTVSLGIWLFIVYCVVDDPVRAIIDPLSNCWWWRWPVLMVVALNSIIVVALGIHAACRLYYRLLPEFYCHRRDIQYLYTTITCVILLLLVLMTLMMTDC